MKIDLLIIATNKYLRFVDALLKSADRFFMNGHDVTYHVFTDQDYDKGVVHKVEHRPWPSPTLDRFGFFKRYQDEITGDYQFYIDADCLFVNEVGDEILSDLVAVQHCGYVGERGTYELRPESTAYIADDEGEMYFGGGFLGGKRDCFFKAVLRLVEMIDEDKSNNLIARHHDESYWNRYLVDNPPTKILSPDYHYPENHDHIYGKWRRKGVSYVAKILLLNKDHQEMRK